MSSSNSSEIDDEIAMAFVGVMDEVHDGRSVIDAMSTMIMKGLISGCGRTTSTMIAYTPIILLSEVSYADDLLSEVSYVDGSFPKHYA
jgi:hypothetical protein